MNHKEALEAKAAERYLLNDLDSSLKESFEEHYFGCPECASALQKHEIFRANAKVVLAERPPAVQTVGLFEQIKSWVRLPVFAPAMAAILIAFIGIRQFQPPSNQSSPIKESHEMAFHLSPQVRDSLDDADKLSIHPGTTAIRFDIDLLPGKDPQLNRWQSYRWEIRDPRGQPSTTGTGAAPTGASSAALPPVPVHQLQPGRHQLILHPADGSMDETSTFVVESSPGGK